MMNMSTGAKQLPPLDPLDPLEPDEPKPLELPPPDAPLLVPSPLELPLLAPNWESSPLPPHADTAPTATMKAAAPITRKRPFIVRF
jgi:hypothetical protein